MRGISVKAIVLMVLMLPLVTPAYASAERHYGPIHSGSGDSGTCGPDWAIDTYDRVFTVHTTPHPVGVYQVDEEFTEGRFTTLAGHSPAACQSGSDNGNTVSAGINGYFHGLFTVIVSNGTYNPSAVCSQATCDTTATFVATVFGGGATYNVPTFHFGYHAGTHGDWQNASPNRGGNIGDITG